MLCQTQNMRMACVCNAKPRCTDILLKDLEASLYQLLQFCIDWIVCNLKQMFIWPSKVAYMCTFLLQILIVNLNNTSNSGTLAYTNFNSFKYGSTLTYACFEEICMSNNGLIYLNNLSLTYCNSWLVHSTFLFYKFAFQSFWVKL